MGNQWKLPLFEFPLPVFDCQRVYPLPTGTAFHMQIRHHFHGKVYVHLLRSYWRRRPHQGQPGHQGHRGQGQTLCRKWLGQRLWETRGDFRCFVAFMGALLVSLLLAYVMKSDCQCVFHVRNRLLLKHVVSILFCCFFGFNMVLIWSC